MSTIISFFGGPGVGKSTAAALVYADMKQRGLSVELVTEQIKPWAWEGRKINQYAQFLTTAQQVYAEAILYGKVDWIITDSPTLLGPIYAAKYYSYNIADAITEMVSSSIQESKDNGHHHIHVLLERREAEYESGGRWESKEEALALDAELEELFDGVEGPSLFRMSSTASDLKALVDELVGAK